MRIRSIRPEFWSSEDVAVMDWPTRLVFIGLWSYVDDNGVGRDVEALIVAALFPLEDDFREASGRVTGALRHLSDHGQITRYRVDGKPYLHVTAWEKHQRIEKKSVGRYPLPTSEDAEITESSPTTPVVLPEPSTPGEGEKGRRGEGEKLGARKRASQAPDSFDVDDKLREWAESKGVRVDLEEETEAFLDFHRAKGSAFADWRAAWQTWMRNTLKLNNVRPIRADDPHAGKTKWAEVSPGRWQQCHPEGAYDGKRVEWR